MPPGIHCDPMKEKKWPALPQDPSWVLEQIERGFREIEPRLEGPPDVPKLSQDDVESAVTRALQEELARLEEVENRPNR